MAESSHRARNRALLAKAREAIVHGEAATAHALLHDLHWFAHDEPDTHREVHELELSLARARGDVRGVAKELLPIAFAGLVSRLEQRGFVMEAEATIDAPPSAVHAALTDFDSYAEWNPWLFRAEGDARVGGSVLADVKLGDTHQRADHRVIVSTPGERFAWADVGWFTPLARGRRFRTLVREGERTHFFVRLVIVGPLARLVMRLHGDAMREGLAAETRALAARVESNVRDERRNMPHA